MDNLTHTVIGLVAGETLARLTRSRRRVSLLVTGMIGGNLPDADLLVSYGGDKLRYLLQHRGYTHTVLGCLALAALLYGAIAVACRRRGDSLSGREHGLFLGAAVLAVGLHLGMDALNNYGVHPFWPFDDHWFYGDALFIVEPSFWLAAGPLLLLQRTTAARIALGAAVVLALAVNVVAHPGEPGIWVGAAAIAAGLVSTGLFLRPAAAAGLSALACLGVTATFIAQSSVAAAEVQAQAALEFPGETRIDHVLTPGPMQPTCWDVLLMQRTPDRYVARQAMAVTRGDAATARCSRVQLPSKTTAPWTPLAGQGGRSVRWLTELSAPLGDLAAHVRGDCRAEALMQFARAPFVIPWEGSWLVGDLRFDREPGPGFAELVIGEEGPCPRAVPWTPPRAALLREGG